MGPPSIGAYEPISAQQLPITFTAATDKDRDRWRLTTVTTFQAATRVAGYTGDRWSARKQRRPRRETVPVMLHTEKVLYLNLVRGPPPRWLRRRVSPTRADLRGRRRRAHARHHPPCQHHRHPVAGHLHHSDAGRDERPHRGRQPHHQRRPHASAAATATWTTTGGAYSVASQSPREGCCRESAATLEVAAAREFALRLCGRIRWLRWGPGGTRRAIGGDHLDGGEAR